MTKNSRYMKKLAALALITFTGVVLSVAAFAMDLQSARNSGTVGERLDGYIEVLKPSTEAIDLAKDVNARRLAKYKLISNENNQPVGIVAKLAAKRIIERLESGQFYQSPDGQWVRK
ncbi:MAG: YdbL family protein [Gammaproteobacteria bacterium]|nr:YdbL family protein [Gammaproteobacteria bacterium]